MVPDFSVRLSFTSSMKSPVLHTSTSSCLSLCHYPDSLRFIYLHFYLPQEKGGAKEQSLSHSPGTEHQQDKALAIGQLNEPMLWKSPRVTPLNCLSEMQGLASLYLWSLKLAEAHPGSQVWSLSSLPTARCVSSPTTPSLELKLGIILIYTNGVWNRWSRMDYFI